MKQKIYPWSTFCSFAIVLLLMPLGHAMMILMEHFLAPDVLHYSAFAMGAVGLVVVIAGVYVGSETKATICGLSGGLLFWTGWVEFLFAYYAWRYGAHCDLLCTGVVQTSTHYVDGLAVSHDFFIDGTPIEAYSRSALKALRGSRPEYLLMPATFGMWVMIVMLYVFCTRTGCRFFLWLQDALKLPRRLCLKPITRHASMVTFMQLNVMMWTCYLLLMICYDPVFFGSSHWFTFAVGVFCLVGSILIVVKQLRIRSWSANLRMAIAAVIVFWTFVEVIARNGLLNEIWIFPLSHIPEIISFLLALIILLFFSLRLRASE